MKTISRWLESTQQSVNQNLVLAFFAVILTLLTYGRTLWLPFFFDDLVQLPFVDRYSLGEHWAGSNESPYYRPLVISVWKLESLIIGRHSSIFQHALNLFFHSLNGCLTAILGMRLFTQMESNQSSRSIYFGILVLTLYMLFPFHHQAIPWPGALFHILVTTLILAAVLAYLNNQPLLALAFAFLAPFCHENGVIVPALIFLIELKRFLATGQNALALTVRPFLFALPAGLWLMIRSVVSTARDSQTLLQGAESILQSASYFFQGLTWPAAILGRGLLTLTGLNDLKIVWLVGGLALFIAFVSCNRSKTKQALLVFGSGWWLAASAPAIFVLPFGYIVNSPRLLSLAGCGIALFWATVLCQLVEWVRSYQRNLTLVGTAGILLLLFGFGQWLGVDQIRSSNRFHAMLGNSFDQATDLSADHGAVGDFPIFINFPSSMAPREKYFPLGNEGAVFWPGYAPQHTIMTTNNEQINPINQQFVQVDGIRSDPSYLYGIVRPTGVVNDFRNRSDAFFYNSVASENGVNIFPAGHWLDSTSISPMGVFESDADSFEIDLLGSGIGQNFVNGQSYYHINLDWMMKSGVANDVTVFVHAVNKMGELVAQADGQPLVGLIPFASLKNGDSIQDIRTVEADSDIVEFRVGLYNSVSGERITFYLADGQRAADDMIVIEVLP